MGAESSKDVKVYKKSPPWLYYIGGVYVYIAMPSESKEKTAQKVSHKLKVTPGKDDHWEWQLRCRESNGEHTSNSKFSGVAVAVSEDLITGHVHSATLSGTYPQDKHPHGIYLLPEKRSDFDIEIDQTNEDLADHQIRWLEKTVKEHRRSIHPVHHGMHLVAKGISKPQVFTLTRSNENMWIAAIPEISPRHACGSDHVLEISDEWYHTAPDDQQWHIKGL